MKKRLPEFKRQEWFRFKKLGTKWRKPRGSDSKMRVRMSGRGKMASMGYRVPKNTRGLHPTGLKEVLVKNTMDLAGIDTSCQVVRISSGVGKRKKQQILKKADELKIRVLNPGVNRA